MRWSSTHDIRPRGRTGAPGTRETPIRVKSSPEDSPTGPEAPGFGPVAPSAAGVAEPGARPGEPLRRGGKRPWAVTRGGGSALHTTTPRVRAAHVGRGGDPECAAPSRTPTPGRRGHARRRVRTRVRTWPGTARPHEPGNGIDPASDPARRTQARTPAQRPRARVRAPGPHLGAADAGADRPAPFPGRRTSALPGRVGRNRALVRRGGRFRGARPAGRRCRHDHRTRRRRRSSRRGRPRVAGHLPDFVTHREQADIDFINEIRFAIRALLIEESSLVV